MSFPAKLLASARDVRLFLTDVDGVWTDGALYVNQNGEETVRFHVHDGYGIRVLQQLGVEIAVVSGRNNPAVAARVRQLGIREVHLGHLEKGSVCAQIIKARGLDASQVAAIGDDLPDLPLLRAAGVRIAPPTAAKEVLDCVHYVTAALPGNGALREACVMLAQAKGATLAWNEASSATGADETPA